MATGSLPFLLHLHIVGETGEIALSFHDSFTAFTTALVKIDGRSGPVKAWPCK